MTWSDSLLYKYVLEEWAYKQISRGSLWQREGELKEINNYEVHIMWQAYEAFKLTNRPASPIIQLRVLRIQKINWLVQLPTTIMRSKDLEQGKEALVATNAGLGFAEKWIPRKVYGLVLASLVAQMVKNLPAMLESWVWFLGWEDPLEEGMTTHSSILA